MLLVVLLCLALCFCSPFDQNSEIADLKSPRMPSPPVLTRRSRAGSIIAATPQVGGGGTGTPQMERSHAKVFVENDFFWCCFCHFERQIPTIRDFEILKPIARGGYGGVYLARKKATHDLYAIKALNRKEMVKRNEMRSIFAERNIMANIHSEHVVKMFFAMASRKYLFFVMEFMAGGDLFSLLRRFGRFEEETTKFYVAEIVLALEDLHKQGIIHRDLVWGKFERKGKCSYFVCRSKGFEF
jgi:hypothetical protein